MAEHWQQTVARNLVRSAGLLEGATFLPFQSFPAPREIVEFYGGAEKAYNDPDFIAAVQSLHAVTTVAKAGDSVFSLLPDIARALNSTEVPDVPVDDLRLPFVGINVDFPAGLLGGRAHEVSRLLLYSVPGDKFRVVYFYGERGSYVNIPLEGMRTLHECFDVLQDPWQNINDPDVVKRFQEAAEVSGGDFRQFDVLRLALNTALYITSPDADVVPDKTHEHALHQRLQGLKGKRKRNQLLEKLAQAKKRERYIVGAKFRLSKEYQAPLTEAGKKWVLTHRIRVMGHFKMQPCGPGNTERKRIWVSPYMKGMTFSEMVQKKYVVR